MFSIPDPRFDRDFRGMLQVRVQMLVSYAYKQGLLDDVTFFGAIHNYNSNIMLGMGYTTVEIIPKFNPIEGDLIGRLPREFDVDLESIVGQPFKPPPKKSRHDRPWVI